MKRIMIHVLLLLIGIISTAGTLFAEKDACKGLKEHAVYWAENGFFGADGQPSKSAVLRELCPERSYPCEHLDIHKGYWKSMNERYGSQEDLNRRSYLTELCNLAVQNQNKVTDPVKYVLPEPSQEPVTIAPQAPKTAPKTAEKAVEKSQEPVRRPSIFVTLPQAPAKTETKKVFEKELPKKVSLPIKFNEEDEEDLLEENNYNEDDDLDFVESKKLDEEKEVEFNESENIESEEKNDESEDYELLFK